MGIFFATMKKNGIRYRGFMLFYLAASIVWAASLMLMTRLQGDMGEAAYGGDTDALVRFLLILTGLAALRVAASALSTWVSWRFYGSVGYKLRHNFVSYFTRLPFSKFDKVGSGEALSIYSTDIPRAVMLASTNWGGVIELISNFLEMAIAIFALIFLFEGGASNTLLLLGIFGALVVLQMFLSRPIQKRSVISSQRTADFNAVVNDSLQNISAIAAYGLEEVLEERYLKQYDRYLAAFRSYIYALVGMVSFGIMAAVVPFSIVFILTATSVVNGYTTMADFIGYTAILVILGEGLVGLGEALGAMQHNAAGAKRLNDNTSEVLEDLKNGGAAAKDAPAAISFKNVSFAYGEDLPLALDNVSFDIKPGGRVAFVGGSGSGKSTVLKLLLGLYDQSGGEIFVAGKKTDVLCKAGLRDIFAYVPQDSFLFPESIGANITLADKITDQSRLEKACVDAGILEFINSLPEKFDSVLTEASENISGGQRQRIAMARAFYKNAPIILFDEATSALDPTTEAAILESFENVAKGRTIIMVAHRARAIAACDTIVVLDGGKVSGIGSHEELLDKNAVYRGLYENGAGQETGEVL